MESITGEDEIRIDITLEMIVQYMVNLAKRDYLNGKGRLFLRELRELGFRDQDVKEALNELARRYEVRVLGDVVLVLFNESPFKEQSKLRKIKQ